MTNLLTKSVKRASSVTLAVALLTCTLAFRVSAASCIISGDTARTANGSQDLTFTGTLDSFWTDICAKLFEGQFRIHPTGLCIIFK